MITTRRLGALLGASLSILLLVGVAWFAVRGQAGGEGTQPTPSATGSPTPTGQLPSYSHIFVVVMENRSFGSIVGSPSAPYSNGTLIAEGALAANYHAIAHPSLPNYLALVAGQTGGITTDCSPGPRCTANVPNLADRLEAAGRSWKAYEESMPGACQARDAPPYAVRHDPFVYFGDVRTNASRCTSHVVPLGQLGVDIASGRAPSLASITPNLNNDMHDGTVGQGDLWLRQEVPQLLGVPASLVVVTWDESESDADGNRVPAIFAGPGVATGRVSRTFANHYSLLRTIEALEGVAPLTRNDAGSAVMAGMFVQPRPT